MKRQIELPTTGLGKCGTKLLSVLDRFMAIHRRNDGRIPDTVSLSQSQWDLLSNHVKKMDITLEDCTYRGLSFRLSPESRNQGAPGNL